MEGFELVTCESVGIDHNGIERFLNHCKKHGIELHRFMVLRHGKCCAKVVYEPYGEEDLHPVYSFSKTLTATAIAFARQEGLLRLDEKIVDLFPEDLPQEISENLKICRIHDLLCMGCGHETENHDYGPDWRKTFFRHPFVHKPGTVFTYNSPGTDILASIVKKKTGMQVTEYLKSRLFDKIGMGEVACTSLPDDLQTELGAGGMRLSLRDMGLFAQFMLEDGRDILPEWYFAHAGKKQIETTNRKSGEWGYGYGYQCWLCSLDGSFRADGAYGQFAVIYPSLDLAIIINAGTDQTEGIFDGINAYVISSVKEQAIPGEFGVIDRMEALPAMQGGRRKKGERILGEETYSAEGKMDSIKLLFAGAGTFYGRDHRHIEGLRFTFDENDMTVWIKEDGTEKKLIAGLDGSWKYSEINGICYGSCARWRSKQKLELEVRSKEALSGTRLILHFHDGKMDMEADDTLAADGKLGLFERHTVSFKRGKQTD